ncbi:MAG: hypothetical protein IK079_06165 [Desulfovibrio sp.]|nr:hypothetical protein [Desulfovibrio sp.]
MGWGKRYCLTCGKEFEAEYIQHVYCCDDCKLKAKRQRDNEYTKKRYAKMKTATIEVASLKARIAELETELAALKEQHPSNYCERMSIRTKLPLPCGKRVECFKPEQCAQLPKDAKIEDVRSISEEIVHRSYGRVAHSEPDIYDPVFGQSKFA